MHLKMEEETYRSVQDNNYNVWSGGKMEKWINLCGFVW